MTHYKTFNVELSNSQLNKLKFAIKNETKVTLNLSLNLIRSSNDDSSFPRKIFLTNTQVLKIRKTFANGLSANINFSKTQLHKLGQSGVSLGRILGLLLKTGFPFIGNALKLKMYLTAAASATDAAIHKKMFRSGFTTLIISNEEMKDIMKIVKSLEESRLLIKGVFETIKNELKEQKGWFLGILLGTLGASLLGNILTGKGTIRAGERTVIAGEYFGCSPIR